MFGRPTIGELYRRLDALDRSTQASLKALDDRLTNNLVSRVEYQAKQDAIEQRVTDLESENNSLAGYRRGIVIATISAIATSIGAWIALAVHIS